MSEIDDLSLDELKERANQMQSGAVPVLEAHDRLLTLIQITHESRDDGAQQVMTTKQTMLDRAEDGLWKKRVQVGRMWREIPYGWFERREAAYFVVRNMAGVGLQKNPTEEEQLEIDQSIIEVGTGPSGATPEHASFLISPSDSFQAVPCYDLSLWLRTNYCGPNGIKAVVYVVGGRPGGL